MANQTIPIVDQFLTVPTAAKLLGIPVATLRRAVNSGAVPHHRPFSKRIRVRLSDVTAVINTTRNGGQCDE